jgi:transcriptional regulator with XRE-family HTH domain
MYLPSSAQEALKTLGSEIKLARKRRSWTIADLASKMGVSAPTVIGLEKGQSTISVGIVFSALWILGLEKDLSLLSQPRDQVGFELQDRKLPKRVRHSTRKLNNEF